MISTQREAPDRLSKYAREPIPSMLGDSDCVVMAERMDEGGLMWRHIRLAGGEDVVIDAGIRVIRPGYPTFDRVIQWLHTGKG